MPIRTVSPSRARKAARMPANDNEEVPIVRRAKAILRRARGEVEQAERLITEAERLFIR